MTEFRHQLQEMMDPVGSSGDDIITFNTLNVSVPELPETPENNNGRWKYHEDVILKDIKDYVSGTYNSHYTSAEPGFKDIQTIDLMVEKILLLISVKQIS